VSYQKGQRERFDFGDVVPLKQHDLKRTVQIVLSANTYFAVPDNASAKTSAFVSAGSDGIAANK